MLTKPRSRRAERITEHEIDVHQWLGRLSMCLAIVSHDLPPHLQTHVRKTIDEFILSGASSSDPQWLRDEMKR